MCNDLLWQVDRRLGAKALQENFLKVNDEDDVDMVASSSVKSVSGTATPMQ